MTVTNSFRKQIWKEQWPLITWRTMPVWWEQEKNHLWDIEPTSFLFLFFVFLLFFKSQENARVNSSETDRGKRGERRERERDRVCVCGSICLCVCTCVYSMSCAKSSIRPWEEVHPDLLLAAMPHTHSPTLYTHTHTHTLTQSHTHSITQLHWDTQTNTCTVCVSTGGLISAMQCLWLWQRRWVCVSRGERRRVYVKRRAEECVW